MLLPPAIRELPRPAIDLIVAAEEAGGTVVVFDPNDKIMWANQGQRVLMPCSDYGPDETFESFFWKLFESGSYGNKQAGKDPKRWLASTIAARKSSITLDFVNTYPWGRMLGSHLRLDDGTSVQVRLNIATSGIGRFFPDHDGGLGVMWALRVRNDMNNLQAALDGLAIAVGLVDRSARLIHRNSSLADAVTTHDGLTLDDDGILMATDACDNIVLGQAIESVATGIVPSILMPLRRGSAPPVVMAVSTGNVPGTAVVAVSRFDEDHASLALSLRQALGITPAEAEIIARVGTGHSVTEIAASRGVSEGTAYNQIKSARAALKRSRFAADGLAGIASLVTKIAAISRPGKHRKPL